jgi:hypothetical protein
MQIYSGANEGVLLGIELNRASGFDSITRRNREKNGVYCKSVDLNQIGQIGE